MQNTSVQILGDFTPKIITVFIYTAGVVLPFAYVLSIMTFYFHSAIVLGKFPSYDQPDPGQLSAYSSYIKIIDPIVGLWIIAFIIWLALCLYLWIAGKQGRYWKAIKISFFGQIIAIIITLSPIFEWYVD